jgi:hypothetical protein
MDAGVGVGGIFVAVGCGVGVGRGVDVSATAGVDVGSGVDVAAAPKTPQASKNIVRIVIITMIFLFISSLLFSKM